MFTHGIDDVSVLHPYDKPVPSQGRKEVNVAGPTIAQRKTLAKMGIAMPDGSYYIRNAAELDDAILAVGRGGADHDDIRKHVMTRAAALKLSSKIPANWNSDGSLKQSNIDAGKDFLAHFGTKGMKWGVRNDGKAGSDHVSADSARAQGLKSTVKKHGTGALTNQELQHLITRLNLEQQHGKLNPEHVSAGRQAVNEVLKIGGGVAKQTATSFASQYASKGIEHLVKKAG